MNRDSVTTGAGALSAAGLIASVRWEAFPSPWGEAGKLGLAVVLLIMGYVAYRGGQNESK